MKSILVLRPGAIGDALLSFPVLKALKKQYNGTRIMLVSNVQVLPLAQEFGVADDTSDFQDIKWSELFSSRGIRTTFMRDLLAQTDLVICWMRDPDAIIERNLKVSGIKHCIIAPGRPPAEEHLHIVDYLARTIGLSTVGARVDDVRLSGPLWSPVGGEYGPFIDLPITSGSPWPASIKAHDTTTKRTIAIHPGSGAAEKCWPASRFAEVIKRLWEQRYPVLLLAGPADTERVNDLLQHLSPPPTPGMFQLLTHAPLLEVAQHLQQCRRYLGNDSGITHLAAMLGIPTVAIFGPTDPAIWRPIGPFVKVIHELRLENVPVDTIVEALI